MTRPDRSGLDAHALLRLMQLASPALPVGGFSYSEGLEAAVDAGGVRDEDGTARWLLDQLQLGLARCDLPLMAQAFRAWDEPAQLSRLAALNGWALATRESHELRQQTQQMGRSLVEWLRHRAPGDARVPQLAGLAPSPAWPVAFALAARLTGAPAREAMLCFAFGWAENMVQAAVRGVPLGQTAGQRVLGRLIDAVPEAVDRAAAMDDDQRQAFTPGLAILSAQHETQYSRLFRS